MSALVNKMFASKESKQPLPPEVKDSIEALIYGNCIGDAIGLLTEFMSKEEAETKYKGLRGKLEYKDKVDDNHRIRWRIGDWTDDSDQMILIMQTIIDRKQADPVDFGRKLVKWSHEGFKELGDKGGLGIGLTTLNVLRNPNFFKDPSKASIEEWVKGGKTAAPNGAVMRTAVLGAFQYTNVSDVILNTRNICVATHADPRCQASCFAVTTAIAQMLEMKARNEPITDSHVSQIIKYSERYALNNVKGSEHFADEFNSHISAPTLRYLNLDERDKIGYTLKCMGAGFWALQQSDFRLALEDIVYEGGDADTNGAVAGALLGCKLGMEGLPNSWKFNLVHRNWLKPIIDKFLETIQTVKPSKSSQQKRADREVPQDRPQERHPSSSGSQFYVDGPDSHPGVHGNHSGANKGGRGQGHHGRGQQDQEAQRQHKGMAQGKGSYDHKRVLEAAQPPPTSGSQGRKDKAKHPHGGRNDPASGHPSRDPRSHGARDGQVDPQGQHRGTYPEDTGHKLGQGPRRDDPHAGRRDGRRPQDSYETSNQEYGKYSTRV